jgi:hypothetical protein
VSNPDRQADHDWHLQHSTQPPVLDWKHPARGYPPQHRATPRTWLAVVAVSLIAAGAWILHEAAPARVRPVAVDCHASPDGARWVCTDGRDEAR